MSTTILRAAQSILPTSNCPKHTPAIARTCLRFATCGATPHFIHHSYHASTRTYSYTLNSRPYMNGSLNHDPRDRLIVIGSGVAGCSTALIAAERYKIPVTLLYAGSLPTDCNSYWAQGGIIYRNYDPQSKDSVESLVADIRRAGAGLCKDDAVWKVARDGPDRVRQLLLDDSPSTPFCNVPFDRKNDGSLLCTLEASHSAPRIIYKADHTGKAITEKITAAAMNHPNVTVVPDTIVTDLITVETFDNRKLCVGARILNKTTRKVETMYGTRGTVLASGGVAGIYQHSTNPIGFNALGSSIALALRSGVHTSDLEYIQFHPTVLYIPNEPRFLLTEALRGEGAVLRDASGRAFAKDFHPDGELAPRDVVARGVFNEMQKSTGNEHNVYLDISHRQGDWLQRRFPSIDAHLRQVGLDLTKDRLPVTPAAHYTCGGITTDLNGCTSVMGLYSAGEAARTGLHGGNRLASTSLLEGLVFGASVADYLGGTEGGRLAWELSRQYLDEIRIGKGQVYNQYSQDVTKTSEAFQSKEERINVERSSLLLSQLKHAMWEHVGVVRTLRGLSQAISTLRDIKDEAMHLCSRTATMETVALRDAAFAGEAVAMSAAANRVSGGAHCIILDDIDVQHTKKTLPFTSADRDHLDTTDTERTMRMF